MKIVREKRIPPQPARVIPAELERIEQHEVDVCDICRHPAAHKCKICNRDVCGRCREYDPTDGSDYVGSWCSSCLQLWKDKYRAIDSELESNYDTACEAMQRDWKAESLGRRCEE